MLFYTGIHIMIEALFEKLNGALSKNTLRAYRSDYAHFAKWWKKQEVEPLIHEPSVMMDYLTHMASQSSVATIVRRLASLSSIFKYLCITDTTKDIDVCLALKKIKRHKGTAQQQAEPLTKSHIEKMLPHCGKGIVGLRNQVLLHLGHQTMRRRSELCRFRFADITELPGNRYGIRLRFSKTDQTGKGKTLPLTQNIFELLMQWREKTGEGYILRGITDQNIPGMTVTRALLLTQPKTKLTHLSLPTTVYANVQCSILKQLLHLIYQ